MKEKALARGHKIKFRGYWYVSEEIVKQKFREILDEIWKINLKTASGRDRLPSIILTEVETIIKQKAGGLVE